MKSLTSSMQSKSHMLSLALSLSTIVILLGIFGLVIVANHRQKKKNQLKAILRSKNLGPALESRKIAREVGSRFLLPRYNQTKKEMIASSKAAVTSSGTNPAVKPPSAPAGNSSAIIDKKFQNRLKKMDFNELISGIMYRMRKQGDFTLSQETKDPVTVVLPTQKLTQTKAAPPVPTFAPLIAAPIAAPLPTRSLPETSFFYKKGSVTTSGSSKTS
jgi:hypothetical protein